MKDWADQLQEAAAAIYALTEHRIRDNRLEADESQWTEHFV